MSQNAYASLKQGIPSSGSYLAQKVTDPTARLSFLKSILHLFNVRITQFSLLLKLTSNFIKFRSFYMASTSKELSHRVDYSKEISTASLL